MHVFLYTFIYSMYHIFANGFNEILHELTVLRFLYIGFPCSSNTPSEPPTPVAIIVDRSPPSNRGFC